MKVLDPIGLEGSQPLALAPRPASLRGGVLGLLCNGKPNAGELLEAAFKQLSERTGLRDALRYEKHVLGEGPSAASPAWVLDGLRNGTVGVIIASGD